MKTKLQSLQLKWLTGIAAGRPVFVFADELGCKTPLAQGINECAAFFEPWEFGFRLQYLRGSIAWGVPMGRILERLSLDSVLSAIRASSGPWLRGILWPLAAINCLAKGNREQARRVLNWDPLSSRPDVQDYLQTADGWFYLLDDKDKARECLTKVEALLAGQDLTDFWRLDVARRWITMFGDNGRALNAVAHFKAMKAKGVESRPSYEKAHALTAGLLLGDQVSARELLPYAGTLADPACGWNPVAAAVCWLVLGDNEEMALKCVAVGRDRISQCPLHDAVLMKAIFDDGPAARRILETAVADEQPTPEIRLQAAEAWMICFEERVAAAAQLDKIPMNAEPDELEVTTALYWGTLLQDSSRSEGTMTEILRTAKILHNPLWLVARCIRDCGDESAARRLAGLAESLAKGTLDWAYCSTIWWQMLGDKPASERCLLTIGDGVSSGDDIFRLLAITEQLTWSVIGLGLVDTDESR